MPLRWFNWQVFKIPETERCVQLPFSPLFSTLITCIEMQMNHATPFKSWPFLCDYMTANNIISLHSSPLNLMEAERVFGIAEGSYWIVFLSLQQMCSGKRKIRQKDLRSCAFLWRPSWLKHFSFGGRACALTKFQTFAFIEHHGNCKMVQMHAT